MYLHVGCMRLHVFKGVNGESTVSTCMYTVLYVCKDPSAEGAKGGR